jgi:hypothetical protein
MVADEDHLARSVKCKLAVSLLGLGMCMVSRFI